MWLELWREAWTNIKTHALRNALAVLGILWGAYAVAMLMSLGQGFYTLQTESLKAFTKPVLWVALTTSTKPYQGFGPGKTLSINYATLNQLPNAFPMITAITPMVTKRDAVFTTSTQQAQSWVQGVSPAYFKLFSQHYRGRLLNEADLVNQRAVVFLNYYTKQELFPNSDPIGQDISIDNIHFSVVGYSLKPSTLTPNVHGAAIPYTVWSSLYHKKIQFFLLSLEPNADPDTFKAELIAYFAQQLVFSPQDTESIQVTNLSNFARTFNTILLAAKIFLSFCGIMTLIVGGIGIANMMYLLVKERTREIGLKMALGAESRWVLCGFLLETGILVFTGGLLALILALISLKILHHISLPSWLGQPSLSPRDFAWIFGFLIIVALSAGYFPARRAALLHPVTALADRGD